MVHFRFFNSEGKHYFTVCHSLFVCASYDTYKKRLGNNSKITFFLRILVFHYSLLYIMGKLAGGGSVAVAVGLVTGDRWQVTGGM